MQSKKRSSFALVAAGLVAMGFAIAPVLNSTAFAADKPAAKPGAKAPKLKAGAAAPEFKPETWVKGSPVTSFEAGKVYVVEFWATWCPPCRESIPHLTEMQKKYKDDVTIIGMASSERKGKTGTDDRLEKVEKFVKEQGDKMNYTVAFEGTRTISKAWMEAAEQDGIPTAFIVGGDGKIAWIGSPLDESMGKKLEAAIKSAKSGAKTAPKAETPGKH